jgi:hypothetical protein
VLPDELAKEGECGKVEFSTDFLDAFVAVAQLLSDNGNVGFVNEGEGCVSIFLFDTGREIFRLTFS